MTITLLYAMAWFPSLYVGTSCFVRTSSVSRLHLPSICLRLVDAKRGGDQEMNPWFRTVLTPHEPRHQALRRPRFPATF